MLYVSDNKEAVLVVISDAQGMAGDALQEIQEVFLYSCSIILLVLQVFYILYGNLNKYVAYTLCQKYFSNIFKLYQEFS